VRAFIDFLAARFERDPQWRLADDPVPPHRAQVRTRKAGGP
jgi:hypothetical protein